MIEKTVLITGASQGIGQAVSFHLAQAGYRCVLVSRNAGALRALSEQLTARPQGGHVHMACDLEDLNSIRAVFEGLVKKGIELYGIVHCAGVMPLMTIENNDIDKMLSAYKINVFSFIEMMSQFYKLFSFPQGGSVVAISSTAAEGASYRQCVYGSSKAALNGTIRHLAQVGISRKVRVNAIMPGPVDTPMLCALYAKNDQSDNRPIIQPPLGIIDADLVAEMTGYLLSDKAKNITGSIIRMDSGVGLK